MSQTVEFQFARLFFIVQCRVTPYVWLMRTHAMRRVALVYDAKILCANSKSIARTGTDTFGAAESP